MPAVTLRPMTAEEFAAYRHACVVSYAEQMVQMGGRDEASALEHSERDLADLLPDGLDTAGQHLLVAEDAGTRVGLVWVGTRQDRTDLWWVWDVEVDEGLRGRGYGRACMAAAEAYVQAHGAHRLGLNVFGGNTVARALYERLGYVVDAQQMSKRLG